MLYYTSDLHFGHANIINYANRPYKNVDHMNCALRDNWNSVVGENDRVIVVGDFAMGQLEETLKIAGQLQGRKFLVPGNHDRCWKGGYAGDKLARWREAYSEYFTIVDTMQPHVTEGGTRVEVNHFPFTEPPEHAKRHGDKFSFYRPKDTGQLLIHGHTHSKDIVLGRQVHVGTDAWNYTPVPVTIVDNLLEQVENWSRANE